MVDGVGQGVRHVLLMRFHEGTSAAEITTLVDEFRELAANIPGITGFEHGPNNSPEGLNRGFTYVFILTFENAAARDAYLPHPLHRAFAEQQLGIMSDIVVVDYSPEA